MAITKVTPSVSNFDSGLTVDNITIDGTEIDLSSGDLTIDVAGDIVLDAGGGDIILKDDGTHWASLYTNGTNTYLQNMISDGDMYFSVNDGGSNVNALIIDGSAAGAATFNGEVLIPEKLTHDGDTDTHFKFAGANDIRIVAGGVEHAAFDVNTIVFNQSGANMDFRVESDGDENMLFVDGGNNRVGIGTNGPNRQLSLKHASQAEIGFRTGSVSNGALIYYNDSEDQLLLRAQESSDSITFQTGGTTERFRIDASGYAQFGATLTSHIGTSQVFINRGVNAAPATSGTTQTGAALRLRGGNNAVLDMGMNSTQTWIQATDRFNLANGYDLALNPNGGKVGIGTNSPDNLLHIKTTGSTPAIELEQDAGTSYKGLIKLAGNDLEIRGSSGAMEFYNGGNNDGDSSTLRMAIKADGEISIPPSASTSGTGGGISHHTNNYFYIRGGLEGILMIGGGTTESAQGRIFIPGGGNPMTFTIQNAVKLSIAANGTFTGSSSNNISDQRLKENIQTIPNALTTIKGLTGRTFTWKEEAGLAPGVKYGFIAQEVESVVSDLIHDESGIMKINSDGSLNKNPSDKDEGEYAKSVQDTGIIPILVEAIKELSAEVEALKAKVGS